MIVSTSLIEVRYAETDKMGVVHHSHYPVYFELGRTRFFEEHLRPYRDLELEGLFCPVLSYELSLSSSLKYGDTLRLETFPESFRGLRAILAYRGYLGDNLVVKGSSVHAMTGSDLRACHPRKLPDCYRELKENFLNLL